MSRIAPIPGLDATSWRPHPLHAQECDWPEKNCYIDFWIELLHALRLEPRAILSHTLAVDFLDDQWTFFKPGNFELRELYGIDVQELTVWRPLLAHVLEQAAAGRLVAGEVDAFWLPDTAATDYRTQHTKTTIAFADIDTDAQRLGYFHNAGYYELHGEDFSKLFSDRARLAAGDLPLFAEMISIDRAVRRRDEELAARALKLLAHHLRWRPATNPFERFAGRFSRDLGHMHEQGLAAYHQWAFASLRQAGSAFELAAAHVDWLASCGHPCGDAAQDFRSISATCKSLILKGARVAMTGRSFDAGPAMESMAQAWSTAMEAMEAALLQAA